MKCSQCIALLLAIGLVGCSNDEPSKDTDDNWLNSARSNHDAKDDNTAKSPASGDGVRHAEPRKTVLHLKPVKIYDRQGWGRPIVARVLLAPAKWTVDGGVQWHSRAFKGEEIQERFAVTRPDGLARFEKLPQFQWGWSNTMRGLHDLRGYGTRVANVPSLKDALRKLLLPTIRSKSQTTVVLDHAGREALRYGDESSAERLCTVSQPAGAPGCRQKWSRRN